MYGAGLRPRSDMEGSNMKKLMLGLIASVLPLVAVAGIAGAEIKLGVVAPRGRFDGRRRSV